MSRPGVVLAVDVGKVRVGVAASDPDRLLASPVETVPAPGVARVAELVAGARGHFQPGGRGQLSLLDGPMTKVGWATGRRGCFSW